MKTQRKLLLAKIQSHVDKINLETIEISNLLIELNKLEPKLTISQEEHLSTFPLKLNPPVIKF